MKNGPSGRPQPLQMLPGMSFFEEDDSKRRRSIDRLEQEQDVESAAKKALTGDGLPVGVPVFP